MNVVDISGLTKEQQAGVFGFLGARRRYEQIRIHALFGLCLICGAVVARQSAGALELWQIGMIAASVVVAALNELALNRAVKSGKQHLVDLGLTPEFAQSVARINIRKMAKQLAAQNGRGQSR